MTAPPDIELYVEGQLVQEFETATLNFSMDAPAHRFTFNFSDKWLNTYTQKLPFKEFSPCVIKLRGKTVIDGYIDDIPIDYSSDGPHNITIAGLSHTGHMIDSSALAGAGSWRNADLLTLCRDVAKPFGVGVSIDPWALPYLGGPFSRWAIEDEETAMEFVQRAARERGMFVMTDTGANVLLTRASPRASASVIMLEDCESGHRTSYYRERHSVYIVKNQYAHSDEYHSNEANRGFSKVVDREIAPHRPLIIMGEGSGKKADLDARAAWEYTRRLGKARRVTYERRGMFDTLGAPWALNTLYTVLDPFLGLEEALLMVSINISVGPNKTSTAIELTRPESYDIVKKPAPKPKKRKRAFFD